VIFVDTGAWFAAFVPSDPDHVATTAWLQANSLALVTTDYVFDELMTLLRVRKELPIALKVGPMLLDQALATLEWVSPLDVREAWSVFEDYRDKEWSFTDCVSFVVIRRLGITSALAHDEHFRQFGTVTVFP
jgi:uncharacterized protein